MRRLLVFLKYPAAGQVKTRLAARLGDEAAAAIARASAELTLKRLEPFQPATLICLDPPEALEDVRAWIGPGWACRPQQGTTLGERLAEATSAMFARGARRVVVIGADSPWLTADDVAAAFEQLNANDVVLGPTEDGGYYLIGLSRAAPALFDGIAWSTPQVCAQTRQRAGLLGLRVHLLPQGYDLDHVEDVRRFVTEERSAGGKDPLVEVMAALLNDERQAVAEPRRRSSGDGRRQGSGVPAVQAPTDTRSERIECDTSTVL